eukprot:257061_1
MKTIVIDHDRDISHSMRRSRLSSFNPCDAVCLSATQCLSQDEQRVSQNDMKAYHDKQDRVPMVLNWFGLDRLGIIKSSSQSFLDSQFAFFQSFQPIASETRLSKQTAYPKPDLAFLKSVLQSIPQYSAALTVIIHGVFVQYTVESTHLMTPFIHCLEMLFNETNEITAQHHLKICLWMLFKYKSLDQTHPHLNLHLNQCVCETVQYHQDHNHLQISIQRDCYKEHLTPLQILLKNIHPEQRQCPTLNISKLLCSMLSHLQIHEYLSTLYITINQTNPDAQSNSGWLCIVCTLLNDSDATACEMCETPKPSIEYTLLTQQDAVKYKNDLLKQCRNDGVQIRTAGLHLNVNIDYLSIGHLRLLFNHGVMPINIRIKDEFRKIICEIDMNELLSLYDLTFSVVKCSSCLKDVYPLLVLHYEAKKKLIRILSISELCKSVVLRNYLGLICDFVCGDLLPNDDIYDNDLRMEYCQLILKRIKGKQVIYTQHLEFFIYWLSKYCLTDVNFLNYYQRKCGIHHLKRFCIHRPELQGLMHRLVCDPYDCDYE